MKSLMLIAMIALPTTAFAVDNPSAFVAYKERRAARKAFALEQRRAINATRPPARGWLAIRRPDIDIKSPIVPLDWNVISQPAIPVRPILGLPYYESHSYTAVPVRAVPATAAIFTRR